jgi:hypothetical protein
MPSVPVEYEAGWAPLPMWTLKKRIKYLASAGIRNTIEFNVWGKPRKILARIPGLRDVLWVHDVWDSKQDHSSFDNEVTWPGESTWFSFCRWQHCIRGATLAFRWFLCFSSVRINGTVKIFYLVSLPCLIDEILYLFHLFSNSHFFDSNMKYVI